MARALTFKVNKPGIKALLKDPGVAWIIREQAFQVAKVADSGAPMGHSTSWMMGRNRFRAGVETITYEARLAEAHHRNLSRALAAASGLKEYVTKAGKVRLATEAQIANWTRGRRDGA